MMNNTTNNGGPAFPEIRIRGGDNYNPPTKIYYGGMTLRDYFAAKAMQMHGEMLSNMAIDGEEAWDEYIAKRAYKTADAMLKARGQA